jgi:hypothetical protein
MVTSTWMAIFWDVAECSLVDIDQHFRDAYCLHITAMRPDDRGSKHL